MRDISAQLQTGLQAFLQQSMENMFNCLATVQINPAPQAATAQPYIVSITPLSAVPAATKLKEPIDSTPSQPPLAINKGLDNVKGFSAIASLSLFRQWYLKYKYLPLLLHRLLPSQPLLLQW